MTETKENKLIELTELLEKKGYFDGVDVSTDISLYDYGLIRNKDTNSVVFCISPEMGYPDFKFDITTVSKEEIENDLKEIEAGYFSFIGSTLEQELQYIENGHIANTIQSINMYNGLYDQSCSWNLDIDDIINIVTTD